MKKKEISGTIKFYTKKVVTKKELETTTLVETWEQSEGLPSKEYFVYMGTKYNLISSVEK
jgi:hypothetical protein